MENTSTRENSKYSIEYILEQVTKIQEQTEYLNNVVHELSQMGDGDSGDCGSPGNIQGQAKAQALADIVKCRETTNQQMLKFYEKMYDDLKPQSSSRIETLKKMTDLVAHADVFAEQKNDMLDTIRQICKENFKE